MGIALEKLYFRAPNLAPDCSTPRSARLRERRFFMGLEKREMPEHYQRLQEEAKQIYLENAVIAPSIARAKALRHIVDNCDITLEEDTVLLGGEEPFFFNLMFPALCADGHARFGRTPDEDSDRMRRASLFYAACFEGHITPGLDDVLSQGIVGIRSRIEDRLIDFRSESPESREQKLFWESALLSCDAITAYTERYRKAAEEKAKSDPEKVEEWQKYTEILSKVPEYSATTFHEALQSFWIVYILVTMEMGGCMPGGGIGLGRIDQFLYPYYIKDIMEERITRAEALELMEHFLLCFRHVDYYTPHQLYTPGSQASIGGVTTTGAEASNELTYLIMEASLRIAMPAPYISLRLHKDAPEEYWQSVANYITGGLGFAIVNDEVLIPAMMKHGRSIEDARDYICSCCYENTIPGREAFHPNASYLNLPFVLELSLNQGKSLLSGEQLAFKTPDSVKFSNFDEVMDSFRQQLHYVCNKLVALVNYSDESHTANRRYPMMSLFFDDCIAKGKDVCAGGARYNLTGCIVAGLPNVVNSLMAIKECVFTKQLMSMSKLITAMQADFDGYEQLRRQLLSAPKWGNGDPSVDALAKEVTDMLYSEMRHRTNPRGGRWQLALYSFVANYGLGSVVGASADGRHARDMLTRNLNPSWGTDRQGPTGILRSLSNIDFTQFPNGSTLDLRFDPEPLQTYEGRSKFVGFLKAFVELGVMTMQISMVDEETLRDAQNHPENYPNLMVKVAGYSARFVELSTQEQEEIIHRTTQRI
jgi:formate C-acetyltransferase